MSADAIVIIPAAGQGKRMDAGQNKLLLFLGAQTILQRTLELFLKHPRIARIYLVIAPQDQAKVTPFLHEKITLVFGGAERQDSVFQALVEIQKKELPRWILVHDGARPFCSATLIETILAECSRTRAAIPVLPLTDTIRHITPQRTQVLERSQLFATQTPQGFEAQLLMEAYHAAQAQGWKTTDDASVVEHWGHAVSTVAGEVANIKITTPQDFKQAQWHLTQLQ